jgi:hypothetical protein
MPRVNRTPEARRQAQANPFAFLDQAYAAFRAAIKKLLPDNLAHVPAHMAQNEKAYHLALERLERDIGTFKWVFKNPKWQPIFGQLLQEDHTPGLQKHIAALWARP